MKRVIAFIKPNMLDDATFALHKIEGFPGGAITEVRGIRRHGGKDRGVIGREPFHAFPTSIRIEIVCADTQVEEIVSTIEKNAHTGLSDDGTIYVSDVEEAVQIRTGEREFQGPDSRSGDR